MKKLLLTGFEPFLAYKSNPTMDIVTALHGQTLGGFLIHGEVLPVEFKSAGNQLVNYIETHKPDVVISLGLAGGRAHITPERIAINVNDGPKDNDGIAPVDELIYENGADGYFTTLPIRQMVTQLKENGFPAKISNSAGAYVCNHVMYNALHHAKRHNSKMLAGFIHIPASHELAIEQGNIPSWSAHDLQKAIRLCVETL